MARVVLFNKPYLVLSQFTDSGAGNPSPGAGRATLSAFFDDPSLRVAGRLDRDSEGLLALTDDGALVARITDPRHKLPKTYWAQVEGQPGPQALDRLARGVILNDGPTLPAEASSLDPPDWLWPRQPPIRIRRHIPTAWIALTLREGRNRQVRRMTAAVGLPTLRLIRVAIGPWGLNGLAPGETREVGAGPLMPAVRRPAPAAGRQR